MRPRWLYPKPQRKTLDFMKKIEELSNELINEREVHGVTRKTYNKAHEELERANRLIEVLTSENDELKGKLAQQEKPYVLPFQPFIPKTREVTETTEVTPNDQRRRVVLTAKVYVELNTTPTITFEVDAKARKVTAIMQSDKRGVGKIRSHLICRDDQVFNEHIFKAATLANLLQQHDSAHFFTNAVQPNLAVGQIVTLTLPNWGWERFEITAYDKDGRWKLNNLLADEQGHANEEDLTILDDTNAQY